MALRHILCGISVFLMTSALYGQNVPENAERLNRYELLCEECLELREVVESRGRVSRQVASQRISDFVAMNRELREDFEGMTTAEQARFEMINRWFSTGVRPLAMDHVPDVPAVSPEIRSMAFSTSADMRILTFVPAPRPDSEGTKEMQNPVSVMSDTPKRLQAYMMADISFPLSYGLMAGLKDCRKGIDWGGYVRFRSNFDFTEGAYSCMSDGKIENGLAFWGSGDSRRSNLHATCGVLAGLTSWLDIYAGAGYGSSGLFWEDIEGSWASVTDFTHKGVAAEIGAIASWRFLCLGAGISTTAFRTASFDLSVGIRF